MMLVRNKRLLSHSGGLALQSGQPTTFTAGFFFRLCAAGMALAKTPLRISVPKDGIVSDWKAVGADLDHTLGRRGR